MKKTSSQITDGINQARLAVEASGMVYVVASNADQEIQVIPRLEACKMIMAGKKLIIHEVIRKGFN